MQFKRFENVEHFLEGLRKVGLPVAGVAKKPTPEALIEKICATAE